MTDKESIETRRSCLVKATGLFCGKLINDEYADLCKKLIDKMALKRTVPFLSGKLQIWAAAVIYAIGQINFLFDPSSEPHITPDHICQCFDVKKSTVSNKAKLIRDMFRMGYWDKEFSTIEMRERRPFKDMVMFNGMIVPRSALPSDVLELVEE